MILFLLKKRQTSGGYGDNWLSGLQNSAQYVVDMLNANKISAVLQVVVDGNEIDKYVHKYQPSTVILEAIWCPPYKLTELQKLYPTVTWVVRLHSEIPFLAVEGMGISWLKEYIKTPSLFIAANSHQAVQDLETVLGIKVVYLPNYFPVMAPLCSIKEPSFDVGCFGALRPMKNQLLQAVAALKYASGRGRILNFHINASRSEQGGENVLKNLRALFEGRTDANLIEHPWMNPSEFQQVISKMDIMLTVSFSETFCLVAANAVNENIPLVTSSEVNWANPTLFANPTSSCDIVSKMGRALGIWKKYFVGKNRDNLEDFSEKSEKIWKKFLK